LQRTGALGETQSDQILEKFFDVGGALPSASLRTEYTVSGLARGQTYAFRYRAINVNGPGPWSSYELMIAATFPREPPAPVCAYESSSATEIVLNLFRAEDDGGLGITGYELEVD
jgi:hypothetical protein